MSLLRIADRYFLGRFIRTMLFAQIGFMIIFTLVDTISMIDLYIDKNVPVGVLALYYWYFQPYIFIMVLPVSMLMASLLATSQLAKFGELTALKAAGVSLYRIFAPVLLFAFLVSLFAFVFGETVTPDFERKKADVKRYRINKERRRYTMSNTEIRLQDSPDRWVTIDSWDGLSETALNVTVTVRRNNVVVRSIAASRMAYRDSAWFLLDARQRDFSSGEEVFTELENVRIDDFSFTAADLSSARVNPEEMNIVELYGYIQKLKRLGSPYERWIVDIFHKLSFPFANLILVLVGLPLAIGSIRGGTALGFGLSLFICFVYYVVMTFANSLGYDGTIHPVLAPMISNIVFGILGICILMSAKK